MTERTEFAYIIDCDKQGCDPKHADHGKVALGPMASPYASTPDIVGHAATLVPGEMSEWRPASE